MADPAKKPATVVKAARHPLPATRNVRTITLLGS